MIVLYDKMQIYWSNNKEVERDKIFKAYTGLRVHGPQWKITVGRFNTVYVAEALAAVAHKLGTLGQKAI